MGCAERDTARAARRSIVALCDIPPGTMLTETMLGLRRPGTGLEPVMITQVIGRTARRHIEAGVLLTTEMLA